MQLRNLDNYCRCSNEAAYNDKLSKNERNTKSKTEQNTLQVYPILGCQNFPCEKHEFFRQSCQGFDLTLWVLVVWMQRLQQQTLSTLGYHFQSTSKMSSFDGPEQLPTSATTAADTSHAEMDAESQHWHDVMRAMLHYYDFFSFDLMRRQRHLNKLPEIYANRLPSVTFDKFGQLEACAQSNQQFFEDMVNFHAYHGSCDNMTPPQKDVGHTISISQQHRNVAVLHSTMREWSAAGAAERAVTFDVLIDELKRLKPVAADNMFQQRVIVPGCGMGRLPVEIAGQGYCCEGNEFSA